MAAYKPTVQYDTIFRQPEQSQGNVFGMDIPLPIGGINVSVPSTNIADNEASDARNKWINKEGRMSTFFGSAAFSTSALTSATAIIGQFEYIKDSSTTYNMVAWDDGSNLHIGYTNSSGAYTSVDATMTTGEKIGFEVYMNETGTSLTSGTASAGTTTTLTDAGAGWTIDAYKGKLLVLDGGTGSPAAAVIKSNTADTITVEDYLTIAPDATTTFDVRELAFSLYYANGTDGLKSWDGTTVATHADAPKGHILKVFKDILLISGGSVNPAAVYASKERDVTNFSQDRFEIVGNESVDSITGIGVYRGQLIVFKESTNVVVGLSTDGVGGLVWTLSTEDFTRGALNHNCVLEIDGELMVHDAFGSYMYGYKADITVLGEQDRMSDKVKPLFDDTDFSGAFLFWDTKHDIVFLGGSYSNTKMTYVFDWKRRNLAQAWWFMDIEASSMLQIGDDIYFGNSTDFKVYKFDDTTYLPTSYLETKDFNSGSDFNKILNFFKFTSKNITGQVGLQIILSLANTSTIALDKTIFTGYTGTWTGGIGVDPICAVGVCGTVSTRTVDLAFLKKRVNIADYYSASFRVKWFNTNSTNFELDGSSMDGEFLSKDHDSFSIYF